MPTSPRNTPYYDHDGVIIHHADTLDGLSRVETGSVALVVTSPPYVGAPKLWGPFWEPANFQNAHAWLDRVWDECIRTLIPGGKLCVQIGNGGSSPYIPNSARVQQWGMVRGVEQLREIIWLQDTESNNTAWGTFCNPADPRWREAHEYILVFRKEGVRPAPTRAELIDRQQFLNWTFAEWRIKAASAKRVGHVAPFPPEIPQRLITLLTFPGETVLDPFAGSGTTLKAAKKLGRKSIGIDHNLPYCQRMARDLSQSVMALNFEPEAA